VESESKSKHSYIFNNPCGNCVYILFIYLFTNGNNPREISSNLSQCETNVHKNLRLILQISRLILQINKLILQRQNGLMHICIQYIMI